MLHPLLAAVLVLPGIVAAQSEASRWDLGGRLHVDSARLDGGGTRSELRRARLELDAAFARDWEAHVSIDAADVGDDLVKDAWIGRRLGVRSRLQFGQSSEPFSLEGYSSSNHSTFLERAVGVDALTPQRALGLAWMRWGETYSLAGGVFTGNLREPERLGESRGVSLRFSWAPRHTDGDVWQCGASLAWREPDDRRSLRVTGRPEAHSADLLVDTGRLAGGRPLGQRRPRSLLGRRAMVGTRRVGATPHRRGCDPISSWWSLPDGELVQHRRVATVRRGQRQFGGIRPARRLGAWQWAVRIDELDLDDGRLHGGRLRAWTFGLNWYLNQQFRLMFNWIRADTDLGTTARIAQMRAAIVW